MTKKSTTATKDATSMAKNIKEISVSEFFSKNRHLLGFDNSLKSLLTTVREAVDNSLDACEEAHILPEIIIDIEQISESKFKVSIEDNGPGILKSHLPNIFAKLLYGSKFHRLKQSRGQQGIGISAAVMYGQMTTGKSAEVISKTAKNKDAILLHLQIDTKKNAPKIMKEDIIKNDYWMEKKSGTKISIDLEGAYKEGKHGVLAYINQTALANPHASIKFLDPKRKEHYFPRLVNELPTEAKEIKPHPLGVELGTLIQLISDSKKRSIKDFLTEEFCRVSDEIASSIIKQAGVKNISAEKLSRLNIENIFDAIQNTKFMIPPTNCLSPLNESAIIKSLYWFFIESKNLNTKNLITTEEVISKPKKKSKQSAQCEFNFELPIINNELAVDEKLEQIVKDEKTVLSEEDGFFVTAVTRPPAVYRGNPFQIEVGLFYGKSLPHDELVQVYRYANRVPLQYQASACAITKSIISTPWKSYGLSQSKGTLPSGPLVIMVGMSSVWVPYTSESKEAVAHYPEIIKELRLAIMEAARRLQKFLNKRKKQADEDKKRSFIEKYLDPIKEALIDILGNNVKEESIEPNLRAILEKTRAHKQVKMNKKEIHL